MKCKCNAEIVPGAKFCGNCGRRIFYCRKCGNMLYPGANFCGICRTPTEMTTVDPISRCSKCGKTFFGIASLCDDCKRAGRDSHPISRCSKCGKSFLGIGSLCDDCKRIGVHNGTWIDTVRKKTRTVQEWTGSKVTDKKRAKQLVIIALVVGLCIAFAGLAGKLAMGTLSANMRKTEFFSGLDSEMGGIFNRSAGNTITKLMISMIKNDSSGFVSLITQLTNAAGTMAGDPYGMNSLGSILIGSFAQEAFAETRAQLMQQAGAYWPLLRAMAYYRELLTIGLIIAFVAAILWFLLDGKISDVMTLNMMPVLFIGAGWFVLVIILTALGIGTHVLG